MVQITMITSIALVLMLMNTSTAKTLIILPNVMKVKQENAIELNVLKLVVKRTNISLKLLSKLLFLSNVERFVIGIIGNNGATTIGVKMLLTIILTIIVVTVKMVTTMKLTMVDQISILLMELDMDL